MDKQQNTVGPQPEPPKNEKKSFWQWLGVYLLIGCLLYGGIYYFMMKKNGRTQTANPENKTSTEEQKGDPDLFESVTKVSVALNKNGFDPQSVTIAKGTMVVWTNTSGKAATVNSDNHPAHEEYPLLNLGEFENGDSFSLIFNEEGTFGYHNHLVPSQTGTVIVE